MSTRHIELHGEQHIRDLRITYSTAVLKRNITLHMALQSSDSIPAQGIRENPALQHHVPSNTDVRFDKRQFWNVQQDSNPNRTASEERAGERDVQSVVTTVASPSLNFKPSPALDLGAAEKGGQRYVRTQDIAGPLLGRARADSCCSPQAPKWGVAALLV